MPGGPAEAGRARRLGARRAKGRGAPWQTCEASVRRLARIPMRVLCHIHGGTVAWGGKALCSRRCRPQRAEARPELRLVLSVSGRRLHPFFAPVSPVALLLQAKRLLHAAYRGLPGRRRAPPFRVPVDPRRSASHRRPAKRRRRCCCSLGSRLLWRAGRRGGWQLWHHNLT